MIWFTSDTHYFHRNIIEYCNRPFTTVKKMNDTLVNNWNSLVKKSDTVFHLGDFALTKRPENACNLLAELNGYKYLIFGNHDRYLRKDSEFCSMFEETRDLMEINVPDKDAHKGQQRIVLCHYAMRTWNKAHYGTWQLFGHSHNSLPDDPNSLSCDVGVDAWNYTPVSYDQIKEKMKSKSFKPIDHHRGNYDL